MPSRWADRWWSVGWFCVHRVQFEGSQNEPKQWSMAKPMDVNRQLLRKRAVSKSMLLLNGFTNVHHISCWLIKVAWQTFLSIMSMSTNSMFPGYPTRNSQSHKVSAFFNQHHWPPVCSSLSHSCCFFCCSAFGLSTVVPLDVPLGTVRWWPSHWSPAFRHCSSHVLMAMPLRDRHARRSVVTLRLKLCKKVNMFYVHPYLGNDPIWLHPDFWKPLENLKRWSETLVVVIRLGPSLPEIREMFIDNWQKRP